MGRPNKFSQEVRERSVRMVLDREKDRGSEWEAMRSVSSKIGCTPETMRKWVRRAECDQGLRGGVTTSERERTAELERENRELKRANEILRKAAAFFAQAELDRRVK